MHTLFLYCSLSELLVATCQKTDQPITRRPDESPTCYMTHFHAGTLHNVGKQIVVIARYGIDMQELDVLVTRVAWHIDKFTIVQDTSTLNI